MNLSYMLTLISHIPHDDSFNLSANLFWKTNQISFLNQALAKWKLAKETPAATLKYGMYLIFL